METIVNKGSLHHTHTTTQLCSVWCRGHPQQRPPRCRTWWKHRQNKEIHLLPKRACKKHQWEKRDCICSILLSYFSINQEQDNQGSANFIGHENSSFSGKRYLCSVRPAQFHVKTKCTYSMWEKAYCWYSGWLNIAKQIRYFNHRVVTWVPVKLWLQKVHFGIRQ